MGKKRNATQKLATANENNGNGASGGGGAIGVLLPGSTLEDYFHSKKFDPKKDGGLGQVSKHLLVGTPTNNAMVMEKEEEVDHDSKDPAASSCPGNKSDVPLSNGNAKAERKDTAGDDDELHDDAKPPSKAISDYGYGDDDAEVDRQSSHTNHDEYEGDYESDSPNLDAAASVAGMSLSDYLQAKESGNLADEDSSAAAAPKHTASTKHAPAAPKKSAQPSAAPSAKKAVAPSPTLISGMSLNHYLGASSAAAGDDIDNDDGNGPYDSGGDNKSPTSKRKKSKTKISSNNSSTKPSFAMPKQTNGTGTGAAAQHHSPTAQDEYATPFQKRQTKKLKAKIKQQTGGNGGASISKSILLAESGSSSSSSSLSGMSLQTKSIAMNGVSALFKDKDKKKPPHQQQQHQYEHTSQPPLLKLVTSSSSTHNLHHKEHHEAAGDAGNGNGSDDDDHEHNERLPPLAHY